MTTALVIPRRTAASDIPIRAAIPSDRPFFFGAWRSSFRDAPGYEHMTDSSYYDEMALRIERILAHADVLVAENPLAKPDEDKEIGFVVFEGTTLHYLFVRARVQGVGIGRALLDAANQVEPLTTFSHWSKRLRKPPGIFRGMQYNPFRGFTS